jgi:hypothetical protein
LFAGQLVFVGEEERISGRGGFETRPYSYLSASMGLSEAALRAG